MAIALRKQTRGSNQVRLQFICRRWMSLNVSECLHSSQPAPDVCGLVCVMTENMDQAAASHWRKGSFVFAPQNAAAESACHCRVYFYLKSSPGFLYSAPIFPLQRPWLFYNYSFGNGSIQCQSWYSQVVDSQLWCFPAWPKKINKKKSVKQASARVVRCYLNPPVTLWLNASAALCHSKRCRQILMFHAFLRVTVKHVSHIWASHCYFEL